MKSTDSAPLVPRRLCSEIQLFDLCDLESCDSRDGRFCADPVMLGRFEKASVDELRISEQFLSEDFDDDDGLDLDYESDEVEGEDGNDDRDEWDED